MSTRWLAAAAALGLALRLLFAFGYWTDQPLTRDEREYLSLARSLTAGQGFTYDAVLLAEEPDPFGRAPGYPFFLAVVGAGLSVHESVPASVKVAQSVVGAIGVVLAGLIAGRLAGPAAATAASLIAACYPPLVWISAYALSEALIWPVGLALVWAWGRIPARPLIYGALTGAAILIRPAMAFFAALAVLWLLEQRAVRVALAVAIGAALVVAPWTARNYAHYGRLVFVASEGGVTFWTGNHPLAIGEGDMAANPDLKRASLALRAQHPELSEEQMEPVYYEEAFAWIRSHPWQWLSLEIRKIFYLVVPVGPSYQLHSTRYYVASLVSYGVLLPAAIAGFWRLGSRRRTVPGLWLLGGSAVLVSLIFFPQERFRIPVIDPVLIICAAGLFARERSGDPRPPSPDES